MHTVLIGFGLGFLVALQLGPMSLLLIRSTLQHGLVVGLAIGGGIAAVDALYASLGAAGAAPLLSVGPLRLVLGVLGTAVLVRLGLRTLMSAVHARAGLESTDDVAGAGRAFRTSLAATASNPLTIVSWAGIFAAASAGSSASAVTLVAGVGLGSATWVTLLACGIAAARRTVGTRLAVVVDVLAGLGLLAFGAALGCRTAREA